MVNIQRFREQVKKRKGFGNMEIIKGYVHLCLKMENKKKKGLTRTLNEQVFGYIGIVMKISNQKIIVIMESKVEIGLIFIIIVVKKHNVIILMISNMDYGFFGVQMEINDLKDIIKKI